jgi:8-oxo-dGTP diphosphatase
MRRSIRYQAAIIRDEHILLLKVLDRATMTRFWLLPGGGQEPGESAEQCLAREVREETHLHVAVVRLLFEAPDIAGGMYDRLHTYLCEVRDGTARPGIEPEVDGDGEATIQEIGWFHLHRTEKWDALLHEDEFMCGQLQGIRESLLSDKP